MNDFIQKLEATLATYNLDWSNDILLLTLFSLFAWIIWRVVVGRIESIADKTRIQWDNAVISAVKTPISTLIWCWPATVSFGLVMENFLTHSVNWLGTLKYILVITIFVWIIIRLVTNVEEQVLKDSKRDETTVQAIAKVIRLAFIVMGLLSVMQTLGLSLSGLLTFGGVGSI
ncbi:hypothetical protein [Vibrio sp. HN007]|uniref:hypothetical protein n=1 Tax=Vibrio iocasae TaxID=3098914 RepID=UPI0035D3FDC8